MNTLKNDLFDLPVFENLAAINAAYLSQWTYGVFKGVYTGDDLNTRHVYDALKDSYDVVDIWVQTNLPNIYSVSERSRIGICATILATIQAVNTNEIENSRFKELRGNMNTLVSIVSGHYNDVIRAKFDDELVELRKQPSILWNIKPSVSGVTEINSAIKNLNKLDKSELQQASLPYLNELLILKEMADTLKPLVVKTRKAVSTKSLLESPKIEKNNFKTCAYCLRAVRLKNETNSTIAYHGFTRHNTGFGVYSDVIAGSCRGAEFQSFEESPDGALAHLKDLEDGVIRHQKKIESTKIRLATITDQNVITALENDIRDSDHYINSYVPFMTQLLKAELKKRFPEVAIR